MRREQEPVEKPGMHARFDDTSKTYAHPAFGQIAASRVQGGTTLYGSDFMHRAFVVIRISRSELHRDHSHDWHSEREQLVEVALSEAQWATFVSSMNVGGGVPCTIQRVAGEGDMPGIPLRLQEDAFRAEVNEKARAAARRVEQAITDIEGELGASLSKAKRDRVLDSLRALRQDLGSNLPFVARSFEEHMERTVERARVEVNAYVQTTVMRAGLQALSGTGPLVLGGGAPTCCPFHAAGGDLTSSCGGDEPPDADASDALCPCGDADCSRPWGHEDLAYEDAANAEEDVLRTAGMRGRRGCGCSGCLSGTSCVDPYNAGGV